MKSFFLRFFSVLIAIIVSFLVLEGAYRLYKLQKYGMVDYPDRYTLGIFETDPLYGAIPTKKFTSESIPSKIRYNDNTHGYEKLFTFNSFGYRGREFSVRKNPGSFRIVTFGGSTTMSIMSADGYTWSSWLEKMLQENITFKSQNVKFEVINGGVDGWRSREGLLRLQNEIQSFNPDLLLVAFNWNDFWFGVLGKNPHERKFPNKRRWWLNFAIFQNLYVRYLVSQAKDGTKFQLHIENLKRDKEWVKVFEQNILAMQKIASNIKAKIILVNLPGLCRKEADASEKELIASKTRVTSENFPFWAELKIFVSKIIHDLGRKNDIQVIDASSCFRSRFSGASRVRLFEDEMHFTEQGSKEVARCVYSSLKNDFRDNLM